jgi:hypothetical protein
MLWFNKVVKRELEPTSLEQLQDLKAKVTRVEAQIMELIVSHDIIRNKVLRKIQFKKEEEEPSSTMNGFPVVFGK